MFIFILNSIDRVKSYKIVDRYKIRTNGENSARIEGESFEFFLRSTIRSRSDGSINSEEPFDRDLTDVASAWPEVRTLLTL